MSTSDHGSAGFVVGTRSSPSRLRAEHLEQAIGINTTSPRLSWQLPDGAREQQRYRITADNGWDTGWVKSAQSVLVAYDGPALTSSQRVVWQVQVRTDLGVSEPSSAAWFETGLLSAEDWQASWIEPGTMPAGKAGDRPAALLRCEFETAQSVVAARLHATAHGMYEAFLNGERVGDAELTPGFTQYNERLQVQTFDVTASIRPGRNAIAVVLSDGWFRGQVGTMRSSEQWGNRLALLAQLQLTHADGSTTALGTGPDWRSSTGHVTRADLIAGESRDLRLTPVGWDAPGFGDSDWDEVATVEHGFAPARELGGASGAPGGGDRPGVGPSARFRAPDRRPRPEHQRLDQTP
jgi:alpha-L-rhamnosidase